MTLKKTAASKRASLPRAADYTKSFLKDWARLSRSGRYDINRLKKVMLLLIAMMLHSGQSGSITRQAATWQDIANVMSEVIFCWCTSLMTVESMAWSCSSERELTLSCSDNAPRAPRQVTTILTQGDNAPVPVKEEPERIIGSSEESVGKNV